HPSPASETSAFNKIRAFSSRWAGLFPFRIRTSSCSRSSPLNRTTYFFTEISFAAMIRLRRRIVDKANHQILTNWLKRATSSASASITLDRALARTRSSSLLKATAGLDHGCEGRFAQGLEIIQIG